ncbi:HNH endonuclease signature motif containing protein [Paraburkholderia phenoliruptrix]|uniref:HNH endonuclease signature motif containing protein n=1 Tax=Paraburkholderia phenoliruptrix TaxID=252970 RepID=UPI0035B53515
MWPNESYLSCGGRKLHRAVWKAAFGTIPANCHIHHRDDNPLNNQLWNLECLNSTEHLVLTRAKNPKTIGALAREKAAEWHRSEEGRLWHKRHAERSQGWTKWKREPLPCAHCGTVFDCLVRKSGATQKFCSPRCKAAAWRARKP